MRAPVPEEMRDFGPEAYIRYLIYAGATRDEAESAARGERLDEPSDNLPISGSGRRFSVRMFCALMGSFFSERLGPEWRGGESAAATRDPIIREPETGRVRTRERLAEDVIVIGLTGGRRKGKSNIAGHLVRNNGFVLMHPFNPGKAFLRGYYVSRGATEDEALRMTSGDLKDHPSEVLPKDPETGKRMTSRWLMEELGQWMGVDMGPEWTIGTEIDYHMRSVDDDGCQHRWVMESIVYEAHVVRARSGVKLVEVWSDVPAPGSEALGGQRTDEFSRTVSPDFSFRNAMDGLDNLAADWDACMAENGIDYGQPASRSEELQP